MRLLASMAIAALAMGFSVGAEAAVYNFSLESANYDVAGQITTAGNLITSISGQVTGLLNAPIGGLDGQPNPFFSNDNMFNPAAPYVSNEGVLFDAGGFFFNIYSVDLGNGFAYYIATNQFGGDYFSDPRFNPGSLITAGVVTAVPELPTWILLVAGFAGLGLMAARRQQKVIVAG